MTIFTNDGHDAPASRAVAITASDTTKFEPVYRGLYVGTAGNVKLETVGGDTVTFVAVSGILPVRCKRVYATDTTASGIVGLY